MITAANTGNRFAWPSFGLAEPTNEKSSSAARQAMHAQMTNARKM